MVVSRQNRFPETSSGTIKNGFDTTWISVENTSLLRQIRTAFPFSFIRKLHEKHQTLEQQKQASQAIKLYYELLPHTPTQDIGPSKCPKLTEAPSPVPSANPANCIGVSPATESVTAPLEQTATSAHLKWDDIYWQLKNEITVRHYSPKTLRTYSHWIHQFQSFANNRPPQSLNTEDVKQFLTFLAVNKKVAASTQNQALNSLLFMFRHITKKDFGDVKDAVRAKRKRYIPVVLSRNEIDAVIDHLVHPYNLVVNLLYGCGLRLFECLQLRVQDLNFDTGILAVHDGKGRKDRSVPLPQIIIPEIKAQLNCVKEVYKQDIEKGYAGTFLFGQLEKKYKGAAKELCWQWFFPAKTLTYVPDSAEHRRYHLHESHVRRAIKVAAHEAQICKRVSSHTFRHSFASHLLQANYDIRTIQELLGHSDVRTTMIYTHTVKSRTLKESKSPLDFQEASFH